VKAVQCLAERGKHNRSIRQTSAWQHFVVDNILWCVVSEHDWSASWVHWQAHRHVGQCPTRCSSLCAHTAGQVCCLQILL